MPLSIATRSAPWRSIAVVAVAITAVAGAVWADGAAFGAADRLDVMLAATDTTATGSTPAIVIAHRGGGGEAPENTVAAIVGATATGADLIELDVQLTADDVPVIMHDWTVDRTTDGTGAVWSLSAEEVTALEAGGATVFVPTLREALQAIAPTRASTMVELKGSWTPEQVALVSALVAEHGLDHRVVLASFDLFSLRAAQDAAPDLPRLLLSRSLATVDAAIADVDASAVAVSMPTARRDPEAIPELAADGIGVFVYTLNTEDRWAEAVALGARGIITDDPSALGAWLMEPETTPDAYSRDTSAR